MGTPAEFRAMLEFLTKRKLKPVVHTVLPMDKAVEAHRLLEKFSQTGKVVLKIA
jgi:NADPH:quinone reductase-like Zn-dependent oxidoreductase